MKKQIIFGYFLVGLLSLWSVLAQNYEFVFYAITTLCIVVLLQYIDKKFNIPTIILWGFNIWIIMHILGGLLIIGDIALYSQMLLPIIEEPYNVLKYDQLVHFYCYFVITLIIWSILKSIDLENNHFYLIAGISILAGVGVGGLNEIIEFLATVFIPDVNVGGYENTAIDIIANTLGALSASLFFRKIK